MNEMIARVIEGWSTYTIRQLGSKFYICKNTGTNAPPLIPDLDMKEAIDRCREMNATEAIEAMMVCTPEMEIAGHEVLDKQDPNNVVIGMIWAAMVLEAVK